MNRANSLVERLVSNPTSAEFDDLANELLAEYHRGGAVDSLRILLQSANDRVVGEGAWIASELGEAGKPLLADIGHLLAHPSKKVRFWSIDCVLQWAGPSNSEELASTVSLVDDAEEAVRWKAMSFLALASHEQLRSALIGLSAANPESPLIEELKWILGPEGVDPIRIEAGIRDNNNARHRKVAVAAAVRIAKSNAKPLRHAASTYDAEVARFAEDMLSRLDVSDTESQ